MKLPILIHFDHKEVTEENFGSPWQSSFCRPEGLWTSKLCMKYGTDWIRYCIETGGYCHDSIGHYTVPWEIVPARDARVLTITKDNLYDVFDRYGSEWVDYYGDDRAFPYFYWDEIAEDYDIVRGKDWQLLLGWDCDSTCFLNWDAVGEVRRYDRSKHHLTVCRKNVYKAQLMEYNFVEVGF